jgi:hypothetical protein
MKTLFTTVFSALLLLALLVSLKFRFEHHLAPATSGLQGELHHARLNIVLLGSSHTRQGYDAMEIERTTGKTAFVVGYDGLDFVSMLPLVNAMLAHQDKWPDMLVIEANRVLLARQPGIEEPRVFFDAPPATKWTLVRQYLRTHPGHQGWLDMWTLASNRGGELILSYPFVYHAIDSLSYNGSYINKTMSGLPPEVLPTLRIPLASANINPDQMRSLKAIIELAKSSGVKLVFADPPMPASVEAQPEMVNLQQAFRSLADTAKVPLYEGADGFPLADPTLFSDSNHLSTAGRELYTQRFIAALLHDWK